MLASASQWFHTGSNLYNTARLVLENLKHPMYSDVMVVGTPVARLCGDDDHYAQQRGIIPLMLYAMAVECWLEGLLVRSLRRYKSEEVQEKVNHRVAELMGDDVSGVQWTTELYNALDHPDVVALLEQQTEAREEEDKARYARLRRNGNHKLENLARAVGPEKFSEDQMEFLIFLSSANQLGRYPCTFSEKDVIPWYDLASETDRWDDLNQTISSIYMEDRDAK